MCLDMVANERLSRPTSIRACENERPTSCKVQLLFSSEDNEIAKSS